ncbi:MAG: site-2 protease family protein [Chloroflexota bacterium]|nr:site-2 protease family protein [Chloroflexota bacterium]
MLHNSFRLFTVRGIEVGVHYSWLIIFLLLTWSLGGFLFRELLPGLTEIEYWILGAIAAVFLFVSVLIHELAHSFMALARGLAARSITLFIFGGVSNLGGEAKEPSTEFWVAIVGPLTSFVLAAISAIVLATVPEPRVELVAYYLVAINLILGAFNLVPGFPLDGGRVLRSIVWKATGSLRRATEVAAGVGRLVAWGLFAFGLFRILTPPGDLFGGIWMAAIAWFLHNAASASLQQVVFETRLRRVRAGDIVRRDDTTVPPGISVAEAVERYLLPGNRRAVPVADNGRLVGMITVSDVMKVPAEERGSVPVAAVMGGRDGLVTARADQRVQQAVELLAEHEFEQLPVLDGDRLLGVLTRADVMRQLQLREALDA